jgi:hypothetical protein
MRMSPVQSQRLSFGILADMYPMSQPVRCQGFLHSMFIVQVVHSLRNQDREVRRITGRMVHFFQIRRICESPILIFFFLSNKPVQLGLVADPAHSNAGYGGSVFLACFNMAYIFVVLPESFTPPSDQEHAQLFRQESALKYIVSPVTVFLRRGPWRKRLAFLALSTFMYALTLVSTSVPIPASDVHRHLPAIPVFRRQDGVLHFESWILPRSPRKHASSYGGSERTHQS